MKQNNIFKKAGNILYRAKEISKNKGLYYVVNSGIKMVVNSLIFPFWYCYYRTSESSRTFIFQGKTYRYFNSFRNRTWRNERAVEIPIIYEFVMEYPEERVLEVGNVLSHYFSVNHDVVDKYEKNKNVINQDVVDFKPSKRYDLIVGISTLEHVGFDENPSEPMKILQAIENLISLLNPKGKIVVTLPLGYNRTMEKLIDEAKLKLTKRYCLKLISRDNKWVETDWKDVNTATYDYHYLFETANGLVIGIIEKE